MPRDNKIEKLSPFARGMLERAIEEAGYRGYAGIAERLGRRLSLSHISRSGIAAFGKSLRDKARRRAIELEIVGDPNAAPARLLAWARANPQRAEQLLRELQAEI